MHSGEAVKLPSQLVGGASALSRAIAVSLQEKRKRDEEFDAMTSALQAGLSKFERGAALDHSTPCDGHCLFHALKGAFGEMPCSLTVQELRSVALACASADQLEAAAASTGSGLSVQE